MREHSDAYYMAAETVKGAPESDCTDGGGSAKLWAVHAVGYLSKKKQRTRVGASWQRRFFELPPPPSHYLRYFASR